MGTQRERRRNGRVKAAFLEDHPELHERGWPALRMIP